MRARTIVAAAIAVSVVLCLGLVNSAQDLSWWALGLTSGQALSMLAASRDWAVGWALALALQGPWSAYALLTGQWPFLVTCVLCTAASVGALRRVCSSDVRTVEAHDEPRHSVASYTAPPL